MTRFLPAVLVFVVALPALAGDKTPKQVYGDAVRAAASDYEKEIREAKVEYSGAIEAVREAWVTGAGEMRASYDESIIAAKRVWVELAKRAEAEYRARCKELDENDASSEECNRAATEYRQVLIDGKAQYAAACNRAKVAYDDGVSILKTQYESAVELGTGTYREKATRAVEKYRRRLKEAYAELMGQG